jgi:hypothetical protein
MQIHRSVLALHSACSTDPHRGALNGILIRPDGSAVACDGHLLAEYLPDPTPGDDGAMPLRPDWAPIVIPKGDAKTVLQAIHRSKKVESDTLDLDVLQTESPRTAVFRHGADPTRQEFPVTALDTEFPQTDTLYDTTPIVTEVRFDVTVLKNLLATLQSAEVACCTLRIRDPLTPIEFAGTPKNIPGRIRGLIMPAEA